MGKIEPIVKWHEKCIVGKGNTTDTYTTETLEKNCIGNIDPCKMITNIHTSPTALSMMKINTRRKNHTLDGKTSANKGVRIQIYKKCIFFVAIYVHYTLHSMIQ